MHGDVIQYYHSHQLRKSQKDPKTTQRTKIVLLREDGVFGGGEYGIQIILADELGGVPLGLSYFRLLFNLVSLLVTDVRDLSFRPDWATVLVFAMLLGKRPTCVAEERSRLRIDYFYMPDGVPILQQDARISVAAQLDDGL
jgi:hypothetical protein